MGKGNKEKCLRHMEGYRGAAPRVCALLFAAVLAACTLSGCGGATPAEQAEDIVDAAVGDTVPLEGTAMSLEIKSVSKEEEVRPSDPSGYFYYYEDKDGYYYYVISGTLENPDQTLLSPSDFGAAARRGRKEYETKLVMENSSGATFMENNDETVGEALSVYILVMVKDGDEVPDQIELYYNDGMSEKNGDGLWDRGIRIAPQDFDTK